jgi:hypothetical protein
MSYTGTVRNGVIMLPSGVGLPDGAQVEVTVLETNGMADTRAAAGGISGISDPGEWQRQTRADRDLPGRGT